MQNLWLNILFFFSDVLQTVLQTNSELQNEGEDRQIFVKNIEITGKLCFFNEKASAFLSSFPVNTPRSLEQS